MQKLYQLLFVLALCSSLEALPAIAVKQPLTKKEKDMACDKNAADKKEAAACKSAVADAEKKGQQEKEKKVAQEKQAAAAPKTRTVNVSNTIDDKKLDYSKAFFTYTPTTFDISINDIPVKTKEAKDITIKNDTLTITYYCEFKGGARKSSHVYTYKLDPQTTKTSISFDWKKEPRIMLDADNAQLVSDIKVDCDTTTTSKK